MYTENQSFATDDYDRLYDKLGSIQEKTRILNKTSKICIKYSIIIPCIIISYFIIGIIVGSLTNIGTMPSWFLNVFMLGILVYILYLIVAIIIVIVNIYNEITTPNYYINTINLQVKQLNIANPQYIIEMDSLQKLKKFDVGDLTEYFKNRTEIIKFAQQCCDNNREVLKENINILEHCIDKILYCGVTTIKPINKKLLSECISLLANIEDSITPAVLTIYVNYTSPAGRNSYNRQFELSYEHMNNMLNTIENIKRMEQEQREQKEKTQQDKNKHTKSNKQSFNNEQLELEKALTMYMLEIPFTKEELNKQRNRLMKAFHPDCGTDTSIYAVKINSAYELLKNYASD